MILVVVCESVFLGLAAQDRRLFVKKELNEKVDLAERPKQFAGVFFIRMLLAVLSKLGYNLSQQGK
jgi:hypothetical protein